MAIDKTFVSHIKISEEDLARLSINSNLSDLEKWEAAFSYFETDEEEIEKFIKRYQRLGLHEETKNQKIVELFCGKGNSLHALERLGFHDLVGVDLSSNLLSRYEGKAKTIVSDCTSMPKLSDSSFDKVIIQGGIHHLPNLDTNLPKLFSEVNRILKPEGTFVFIEPWLTPFLQLVHFLSSLKLTRRINLSVCAFSIMVFYERETYQQWLSHPDLVLNFCNNYFKDIRYTTSFGKIVCTAKSNHD